MGNDTRCSIEGCNNNHLARGWCTKHYSRWRTHGDPLKVLPPSGGQRAKNPSSLFWVKVDAEGDCWEWLGARRPNGYGIFASRGVNHGAHRFAWELLVGKIPEGLVIDHLCKNRGCVNPDHLEPVTYSVNNIRGAGPALSKIRRAVKKCKNGHDFTEGNTYRYQVNGAPRRACRQCKKDKRQNRSKD